MSSVTWADSSFTYHNSYQNTFHNGFQNQILLNQNPISDMSTERDNAVANDPALQRFTATGRPIPHPKESREGRSWQAAAGSEALGAGPANFAPVRFTDDSMITIAVLPSDDAKVKTLEDSSDDDNPIKEEPKKKFGFFRRKSAYSKKKDQPFVMKQVTRRDYLKYYAKDDDGNYTGTEDPAPDCILNNEKDRFKKRKAFAFREAHSTGLAGSAVMM